MPGAPGTPASPGKQSEGDGQLLQVSLQAAPLVCKTAELHLGREATTEPLEELNCPGSAVPEKSGVGTAAIPKGAGCSIP